MNRQEQAERNLDQAQDFLTRLLNAPRDSWPPGGATIVFTPDNDPELTEANRPIIASVCRQDPDSTIALVSSNEDGTFDVAKMVGGRLVGRAVGTEDERAKDERRGRAAS